MPWAKFDEHYPMSRKVRRLTDAEFRLDVSAVCYSSTNLTDGHIARADIDLVSDVKNPLKAAAGLVRAGRWHGPGHTCTSEWCRPIAEGWLIHDYLHYNPSRDDVLDRRKRRSEAGRTGGLASVRSRTNLRAIRSRGGEADA